MGPSAENGLRDRPLLAGQAATGPREGILRAMHRPAEIHGPVFQEESNTVTISFERFYAETFRIIRIFCPCISSTPKDASKGTIVPQSTAVSSLQAHAA